MKLRLVVVSILVLISIISIGSIAQTSSAQTVCTGNSSESGCDPNKGVCYGAAASSPVCQNKSDANPISGKDGIILRAVKILSYVVGITCVIMIIVGGIRYILSQGDSSTVSSAKSQILYALVGLAVVALSQTIIVFVVNRV